MAEGDQIFDGAVNMEDDEELTKEDYTEEMEELPSLDIEEDYHVEVEAAESSKLVPKTSYEPKIQELFRNLFSLEFKIHSEASKEFIKLLKSDSGRDLLYQYVGKASNCKELFDAWKLRQGKPGVAHVLFLIAAILDHPDGKYKKNDIGRLKISRELDHHVAQMIIKEKLEDIYTELNSKEARRQNAALSVLAAIVRRGVGLASELMRIFDFKLPSFPKLAESHMKRVGNKSKFLTRHKFIEFAMSFLEIGDPNLLRWILQQRDMYFSILRGLANDDDDTIIYVLSTLRDRVLTPDSLVSPGLRSVLFGSVTLDQLISISGNQDGGPSAKIAHEVLVMVCMDPSNGLMPDMEAHPSPLKGNPTRLMELIKKLRATEVRYHRELLLGIVQGRPYFGSAYMDEFPYLLEPRPSSTWFSAISLASDLLASTRGNSAFTSLSSKHHDPPSFDSSEMQCFLKCINPRSFNRIVVNRGLLYSDVGVRHASMRFLLEALKSLDCLLCAIDCKSCSSKSTMQEWMSLKQKVQDAARAMLPDSQVLYQLLASSSHIDEKSRETGSKRQRKTAELAEIACNRGAKRLKSDMANEDVDIVISGINPELDNDISKERGDVTATLVAEFDKEEKFDKLVAGIWGLHETSVIGNEVKDAESYFHSKLLDALTLYLRTMPMALDGSYDFFKLLPSNPFTMSSSQQHSLLSLLIEYTGCSHRSRASSIRPHENMYKHLHTLLELLICSPLKVVQDQAYILVRAAMLSTGLFDRNCLEIDAWLLFLPGYRRDKSSVGSQAVEVFQKLSKVVVSFLCDAVSTIGNSLYKYMDQLRCLISNLKDFTEVSPDFSPLFNCTLSKCLRLLDADSVTFEVYEKSMISTYVCNTLSFILQTQVDGRLLSSLINLILTERFGDSSVCDDPVTSPCEWRPLKSLLHFSRSISHQKNDLKDSLCEWEYLKKARGVPYQNAGSSLCSIDKDASVVTCHLFEKALGKIIRTIKKAPNGSLVGAAKAFCSSLVCASPDEILENFPVVVTISARLFGARFPFLSSLFFLDRNLLIRVANRWPDMLFSSLELVLVASSSIDGKGDALGRTSNNLPPSTESMDFDSMKSTIAVFSSFLKHVSFHVLFPGIMAISNSNRLSSTKLVELLKRKLSEGFVDESVVSLRLLLFWAHQIQSSYRLEPLSELEQLFSICYLLINHVLGRLLVVQSDPSNSETIEASTLINSVQEISETIFHHPVVLASLSNPLCCDIDVTHGILEGSLLDIISSSNESIHPISNSIMQLLTTVADHLLGLGNGQNLSLEAEAVKRISVKAFNSLIQWVVSMFRKKFEMPINRKKLMKLLPNYYVFHSLIHIIPPFMLFELVDYIFECGDSICSESVKVAVFSIGCYIAGGAFDLLSSYVHQPDLKTVRSILFWEVEGKSFDLILFEKIFHKITYLATHFKLESSDLCLLKAANVVYMQKFMQPETALFPPSMTISRGIMSIPVSLLAHCMQGVTATKAKLLFVLTQVSPLHLTLFGQMFSGSGSRYLPLNENVAENPSHACGNEQLMMLLPVALSYLKMNSLKFGLQSLKHVQSIPSIYSEALLDGFLNWKSFTTQNIFQEEYNGLSLSSTQELLDLFNGSLLGKVIHMLQHYLLNVCSLKKKKRMKLFDSICQSPGINDDLFDFDVNNINLCSLQESLNFINIVIAKISFCRMLLFPRDNLIQTSLLETNGCSAEISPKVLSDKEVSLIVKFISILVNTLQKIVKKFTFLPNGSVRLKSGDCSQLFRYLEVFILRTIFQLSVDMRCELVQMTSISFIEQFARSSLLHRFEDPVTLKVLRFLLITLCEGKFSCAVILELLQAHSKFVSSILWSDSTSDSSDLLNTGMLLRPMSSILKSPFLLGADQRKAYKKRDFEMSLSCMQKLELIKLIRVLYHFKANQGSTAPAQDGKTKSTELLSLLLSCYGATVSEMDMEIFDLMQEIVSIEGSEGVDVADMDYLWGSSALKLREKMLENSLLSDNSTDREIVEERRRLHFRENLGLDTRKCVETILKFPYDRVSSNRPLSLKNFNEKELMDELETSSASIERIQTYDPAFILRFSIHALSMGYLESIEFVGLGLLGIAFMSISSLDEGIRKLGYEAIDRFKNVLESCQKRKIRYQLQLLLTHVQLGITEPWKRIPPITAIFVAEASLIMLDPSHEHCHTIRELLSQNINFKSIPLFHPMFGSVSTNPKTDRLWILRLLHAGLNSVDDALICIKNRVIEILLSFYTSSLSDYQSKAIILQIMKKSIQLPVLASYLVQQCNLIPWVSSVLSSCSERLCENDNSLSLTQVTILLEVINDIISVRSIRKWLKEDALEQLSELTSLALKLVIGPSQMIKENLPLANIILQTLISTLRISQERSIDQPHFTLSFDGLSQLSEAIDSGPEKTKTAISSELVVRATLMTAPPAIIPHKDGGKLVRIIMLGIPTASTLYSNELDSGFTNYFGEQACEDSLISKLLRWVIASVILGRISKKPPKLKAFISSEISNIRTLQLLLDCIKKMNGEVQPDGMKVSKTKVSNEEALAAAILYLQQVVGMKCKVLPSVIAALCLLFLLDTTNTGTVFLDGDQIDLVASLCSKIRCPPEANPAWRWSYDQPWTDSSCELTELQKLEEHQACQALLVLFSEALGGKSSGSQLLSHRDLEESGVFLWERDILDSQLHH